MKNSIPVMSLFDWFYLKTKTENSNIWYKQYEKQERNKIYTSGYKLNWNHKLLKSILKNYFNVISYRNTFQL